MVADLESELLFWIDEESREGHAAGSPAAVAVKLLVLRLAVLNRADSGDLTQSVEISLGAFERADLFRVLRQLARRELIDFVDASGEPLEGEALQEMFSADAADKLSGFVALSAGGRAELKRLAKVRAPAAQGSRQEPEGKN